MKYLFKCEKCNNPTEIDIKVEDYDREKERQTCICGGKMKRVIEWQGWAKGSGGGWCGKSSGSTI